MSSPRAAVEEETRRWLAAHYTQALDQLGSAPDPVWEADGTPRRMTGYHFQEVLRKLKIFRWLDRLEFGSALDVGSGFDIFPELIHARYGAEAFYSDFTHAMNLPYGAAASRLDHAVTVNAARLPFPDDSIDLVMASEVLEHLVRPIEVIAELVRVARRYVVMTSLEALAVNRWERARQHWHIDTRQPHVERNFFLAAELDAIFGPRWLHENLLFAPALPASTFAGAAEQAAAYAALDQRAGLVAALVRAAAVDGHGDGAMGIVLVKPLADAPVRPPDPRGDAALADWLVGQAARYQDVVLGLAAARRRGEVVLPPRERPVAP
ncbi:MAG: class I SAM-dependent methyltransferase, partial [Deltaproteobacteria bacterium]|nr:class I SAM-dependent methyltransferase [Deltaproteobacteria bacterium]